MRAPMQADLGGHDFFAAYQAYTQQLQAKVPGEQEVCLWPRV